MPKYEIEIMWHGYSRGVSTYVVEAESEEAARELWHEGDCTERIVVRDDTEKEIESIKVRKCACVPGQSGPCSACMEEKYKL